MEFTLHQNLFSKAFVLDLPFCRVLLEDNCHYPWLILVPRRNNLRLLLDLTPSEEKCFNQELKWAQTTLLNEFKADHINVGAIGNKTPQLHIHVIGRFLKDPAWPNTVWDHKVKDLYTQDAKETVILKIKNRLNHLMQDKVC
ncbi:HIT domain-containing protein [Criblamydia sequanensis]|uniref:Histidine triad (HIT) protein n=1 Tax=Candidatus Criblamydia sequanensis CRIB-18 TaxID=1437425 RepID=A0A090CYQ9_9BACT|nr:HIT domain-containing protein [Criblamydia sequanensis]CDR33686.1 Histidine triad (HIT) protein [Criblamydia sequanensis CRIB-18]